MFSMTVFTLYLQIGFTLESLWSDSWTTCNLVLYRKACQPLGPACSTSCPPCSPWAHHWDHGRKWRERGLSGKGSCERSSTGCLTVWLWGCLFLEGRIPALPTRLYSVGSLCLWVLVILVPTQATGLGTILLAVMSPVALHYFLPSFSLPFLCK